MGVAPEFVDEAQAMSVGAGQFEFYGQIFELHVQQLVKLKGTGGTRRYEVLVRDAHADNEFGVAPERVLQDVHDPSANSDLDRIVVEQLVIWLGENRGVWESEPASFSVNVGMGTIADPKFAGFVALTLKNRKVPAKALGFEISEKSCVEQVRDVDNFVQACEKIGCHVVLDDFTFHHNAIRWLGSPALKFLKLDPKITAVAMKERCRRRSWSRSRRRRRCSACRAWPSASTRRPCANGFRPSGSTTRRASCSISRALLTASTRRIPPREIAARRSSRARAFVRRDGSRTFTGWPASIPCVQPRVLFWVLHSGGWVAYVISQLLGAILYEKMTGFHYVIVIAATPVSS